MPSEAASSAATALRCPTSHTKITSSSAVTAVAGELMIRPSGTSVACAMWSRAYSPGSRTSMTVTLPPSISSFASAAWIRRNGSPYS